MRIYFSGEKNFASFVNRLAQRGILHFGKLEGPVRHILKQVQEEGDSALIRLTRKFDGWGPSPKNLRVTEAEIDSACKKLKPQERRTLEFSAKRIRRFHVLQRQTSWSYAEENGTILGQILRPLKRVGIYVPGGKAAYPSSVLMSAIPAKVAGVPEVIMVTPAPRGKTHPVVLAAARIARVDTIYKIGGAQAVAALAFGTQSIPKVDKIVGPGNIYVATAKRLVFGEVAIDSIAGPSEILIIADKTGEPSSLAADLLAQAEHDPQSMAILLCASADFAEDVSVEVDRQLGDLPRRKIAEQCLREKGGVLVVKNLAEAVEIANLLAPEHVELAIANPSSLVPLLENAGAIFLGHLSPEAIGDYVAGPNHVLPTGGAVRFSSPLGVYDFYKRSSLICLSPAGWKKLARPGMHLAEMENLEGHRRSIARREVKDLRDST